VPISNSAKQASKIPRWRCVDFRTVNW